MWPCICGQFPRWFCNGGSGGGVPDGCAQDVRRGESDTKSNMQMYMWEIRRHQDRIV